METLIYESGGEFLERIHKTPPQNLRLLCPVYHSELVFAPDQESANRLKVYPGAYCPKDARHLRVRFHVK